MIKDDATPEEIEAHNVLIRNEGNLPVEHDLQGRLKIKWEKFSIREQFPWTRALGEK